MSQIWGYMHWNQALGHHFFNPGKAGQDVFLATDKSVLQRVSGLEQQRAVASFLQAIRSVCGPGIGKAGWERGSLVYYRTDPLGWRPACIALLCFQVFVAFQMEAVIGERTDQNYWGVMNELLGYGLVSNPPITGEVHQFLWRNSLERWANHPEYHEQNLGNLLLPPIGTPGHKHILLPLSQALLRREDCIRLHGFFQAADLRPGDELEPETLDHLLSSTQLPTPLTNHALRVLNDDLRRDAALAQVLEELSEWDGTSQDRPKASVYKMWLRFSKRRPERYKVGIARLVLGGLEDEIEGEFSDLLRNEVSLEGVKFRPPVSRRQIRLLVRNDSLGCYLEQRYLGPGQEAVLLISGAHGKRLLGELVSRQFNYEICEMNLPGDWMFVWLEVPLTLPKLPNWIDIFEPNKVSLRISGGLKLRPGVWMSGAGPTVQVVGSSLPESAWISGHVVQLKDGVLHHPCLNDPGKHLVVLPHRGVKTYICVEDPTELAVATPSSWYRITDGWPVPGEAVLEPPHEEILGYRVLGIWPAFSPQRPIENSVAPAPVAPIPEEPVHTVSRPSALPGPQDPTQALLIKLLVSVRRGVHLVSPDEVQQHRNHPHPVIRVLCQRLHSMKVESNA